MQEKRTELIQVKVTPAEKKQITKNAKKSGLDISNFVRFKCSRKEELENG